MAENYQDEDEPLKLPSDTLAALQEFYSDRQAGEKRFKDLRFDAEQKASEGKLSMDMFSEDWNASQFWYSDETAIVLASQLLAGSTAATNICIVSAPSVFVQVKNLIASHHYEVSQVTLLEFDSRFDVFREFIHYDFQYPLRLPGGLKGQYDRILCDPPFLSSDCQTKAAMTVSWLSKASDHASELTNARRIICTGVTMEDLVLKLYSGMRTTTFEPKHAQDRLSNDFGCYANFECDGWSWR
ncbi:hypothetical protein MMC21_001957 [Puttea exsequens]|nr:hypothetical protein [Puttea exsequens]